ncbi:SGSM2 isoform 1 [Pan troglodytes]|uniref:Small G protein signaling modulator 2 n=2 Tax=Homininae TaxID=207598 RepID=I3L1Y7_HUMAN|nr:SGSM2 isoform 1 [Pan troglodytes]
MGSAEDAVKEKLLWNVKKEVQWRLASCIS